LVRIIVGYCGDDRLYELCCRPVEVAIVDRDAV
jgi:hypothetical protein